MKDAVDSGRSYVVGANLDASAGLPQVRDRLPMPVPGRADLSVGTEMAASGTPSPTGVMKSSLVAETKKWNTKNLLPRLGTDLLSASCAAGLVAPIISMIDRSIMENASGANTLANSIKTSLRNLVLRPGNFLFSKPVALIFMLYGGTYLTANMLDTVTSTVSNKASSHVTAGTAKFAASSAANVGLCIYKDQVFVKLFGPPGVVARPVTPASYLLFTARDCMTIFASFNVPPALGPYLHGRMADGVSKHVTGMTVAQFAAPAAVQLLSTPLHLLGLDFYNRPGAGGGGGGVHPSVSVADRWAIVRKNWAISTGARICRIVPAFGIGGVVNTKVRMSLMTKLE